MVCPFKYDPSDNDPTFMLEVYTLSDFTNQISKFNEFIFFRMVHSHIHNACAAVSLARGSLTSNFRTKSFAAGVIFGQGLRRKSGLFFKTCSKK